MDIVTCDGNQLLNLKSRKNDVGNDYIGFKYIKTSELIESNLFSFLMERGKLIGVIKYRTEIRRRNGIKGLIGMKFLYIRLYFIDIRSDIRGQERLNLQGYLIDEFCDVIDSYNQNKKILNIFTLKGKEEGFDIESVITSKIDNIKFITKGRRKYGN